MKRSTNYEQIIGHKLNSISAPDAAALWSSMEELLDKEMPQQEEKKPRVGAWWSTTNMMIAASLFIAVGSVYTLCKVAGKAPVSKLTVNAINTRIAESNTKADVTRAEKNEGDKIAGSSATLAAEERVAKAVVTRDADKAERSFAIRSGSSKNIALSGVYDAEPSTTIAVDNNNVSPVAEDRATAILVEEGVKEQAASEVENRDVTVQALESASPVAVTLPAVFSQQSLQNQQSLLINPTIKKKKKETIYLDKGVSAGLAMNLPVAISNQVKNELDMKGKKNKWQDYIPSVYAQLHLSKKLYVQAEFQPVTAQYTPNFTLYNRVDELNPDEKEQKVIQLNKLYYTSLPLSVHYKTPLKNVTVGVGVQYSKLKKVILQDKEYYHLIQAGGVFKVEERKNDVTVKDPEDVRSHNTGDVADSVAHSIRREDWRLLADVGYQYKGFNLGVRYTSGLGNYINSNFTNLSVKDRNEALQVYLRFNLFDGRKK